eukprot:624358_1
MYYALYLLHFRSCSRTFNIWLYTHFYINDYVQYLAVFTQKPMFILHSMCICCNHIVCIPLGTCLYCFTPRFRRRYPLIIDYNTKHFIIHLRRSHVECDAVSQRSDGCVCCNHLYLLPTV